MPVKVSSRSAIFPGTFDPITLGHVEVIRRALLLFDELRIGVGINTSKSPMFTVEQRISWMRRIYENEPRIRIETFSGLTVGYARDVGVTYLIRGLRSSPDFEYEKNIDLLNKHLMPGIDTIYFIAEPATQHIASSLVREVVRYGGSLTGLVPEEIITDIVASRTATAASDSGTSVT